MSTKFITFLGTNPYIECSYYFKNPDEEYFLTRFVQISLIRHLILSKKMKSYETEILILVTDEAKNRNWNDNFDSENIQVAGLKTHLQKLQNHLENQQESLPKYRLLSIPEGKSEHELWEIFNLLADQINENDSLFFDITHSFRSLPMLVLVALNYLRVIKNVQIKGIFYGAFESLGTINEVKRIPVEKRNAPIFDLTPFIDLMQWTTAADHLIRTGNTFLMSELTKRKTQPLLKKSKGENQAASKLHELSYVLSNFTKDLYVVNGPKLSNDVFQVKQKLENAKQFSSEIPPLEKLFEKILSEFYNIQIPQNIVENTIIIINYCFKHGLVQQGFTLLDENLITYGCIKFGLDYRNSKNRRLFTSALKIKKENLPEKKWIPISNNSIEEQKKIIKEIIKNNLDPLIKLRIKIASKRNALNHASFNTSGTSYERYVKYGIQLTNDFQKLIKEL